MQDPRFITWIKQSVEGIDESDKYIKAPDHRYLFLKLVYWRKRAILILANWNLRILPGYPVTVTGVHPLDMQYTTPNITAGDKTKYVLHF